MGKAEERLVITHERDPKFDKVRQPSSGRRNRASCLEQSRRSDVSDETNSSGRGNRKVRHRSGRDNSPPPLFLFPFVHWTPW